MCAISSRSTPKTKLSVLGALRFGSIWFAEVTAVGFAGLNPPPCVRRWFVSTSLACAKWSWLVSTQRYVAEPTAVLGLMPPIVVGLSWLAYRLYDARATVRLCSSSATVMPARGENVFQTNGES